MSVVIPLFMQHFFPVLCLLPTLRLSRCGLWVKRRALPKRTDMMSVVIPPFYVIHLSSLCIYVAIEVVALVLPLSHSWSLDLSG